ncbi:hypothetical protein [Microbacterium sp. 18062]|nr:hypothetical protein [Microbacterium sp. 18062]
MSGGAVAIEVGGLTKRYREKLVVGAIVRRNLRLFFRDRLNVFFS